MNAPIRSTFLLAALGASSLLAACSGSSTPVSPVARPTATAQATSPATSSTTSVAYGAFALRGASLVGPAKLKSVGADVFVAMKDAPGLIAYAKAANTRGNSLFRHWLTPQELGDRFGAPAADYAAEVNYFRANGIAVGTYPQRQMMHVNGPQSALERVLGLQFGVYRKNGRAFVAPMSAPHPSSALHVTALAGVVGITSKLRRYVSVRASASLQNGYSPEQIANGFDYAGAYAAGYKGSGITIGIIGTGPITDGDSRIHYGDVAEFKKLFSESGTGTVTQDVDLAHYSPGYSQSGLETPPPVTSPNAAGCDGEVSPGNPSGYIPDDYTTCNPEDTEAQLDTEQAAALAPDANVNFYIAYNPSECYGTCSNSNPPEQEIGLDESDNEIQQAIADNKSDVVSLSYGEDEYAAEHDGYFDTSGSGFGPTEFASLASEGIAVFASSGDFGAEECQNDGVVSDSQGNQPCVVWPASDPSVTGVGGVNAPFNNAGGLVGPITGWGEATQLANAGSGDTFGSGGGCSIVFAEPSYGSGANLPCSGKRASPDLALDGDTNTGVAVVIDADPTLGGRYVFSIGGTSVATPEAAAMWALAVGACKASATCTAAGSGTDPYRLGIAAAYLYPIYENSTAYAATFYDVLFGNNSIASTDSGQDPGYDAGKGYDQVTGLGVPYARHLVSEVLTEAE